MVQSAPQTRPWREQYEGMIPSMSNKTLRYCAAENIAQGNMAYGSVVSRVLASPRLVTTPTATAARVSGIVVANLQRAPLIVNNIMFVRAGEPVTVLEEGDIVMFSETAAKRGDQVFFRFAANAGLTRISAIAPAAGIGLDPLRGGVYLQDCPPGLVWVKYTFMLPAIV